MTSIKQVLKFETNRSRSVNKDYNLTGNVHFAKYFVTVDNDGERFLALVLFHVSTYALFYQAQSNQSQKETNVPYPTPNQTKLAIFTKHSNGNINISCCGCQVADPRLEWEYWALPRPRLGWFELILHDNRRDGKSIFVYTRIPSSD